jgi:hypothetical protein
MKISEHIISPHNGTEYFTIYFEVSNPKDLTLKEYKEIEDLIYKKIDSINKEKNNI